jgi:hypothetical protein
MGTIIENILFYELQNQGNLASRTEFRGTSGQSPLKPINPVKTRKNGEEWGANVEGIYLVHPTASPHCLHGRSYLGLSTCPDVFPAYFRNSPEAVYPACSQTYWYCAVLVNWN